MNMHDFKLCRSWGNIKSWSNVKSWGNVENEGEDCDLIALVCVTCEWFLEWDQDVDLYDVIDAVFQHRCETAA